MNFIHGYDKWILQRTSIIISDKWTLMDQLDASIFVRNFEGFWFSRAIWTKLGAFFYGSFFWPHKIEKQIPDPYRPKIVLCDFLT